MSASSTDWIARYLRSRMPLARLVPLALFLAAVSLVDPIDRRLSTLGLRALVAFLLVVELRLWDDLEDRARDGALHPERVLVRAPGARPFVGLAVLLGLGGGAVLLAGALPSTLAVVYLGFTTFEFLHDRSIHTHRGAGAILVVETAALGLLAAGALWPLALSAAALFVPLAVLLRHRARAEAGAWSYAVFVPGLLTVARALGASP